MSSRRSPSAAATRGRSASWSSHSRPRPRRRAGGQPWAIRSDHTPGDLGFDPLGLKPESPAELAEMQTKELNNGRLAMIAIAGMVVQEGITGAKLF